MEQLRLKILEILVAKKRYSENKIVEAEEIANQLNIGIQYVHEELEKMEFMGLVKLAKTMGPKYAAWITPKGLLTHEQLGKD